MKPDYFECILEWARQLSKRSCQFEDFSFHYATEKFKVAQAMAPEWKYAEILRVVILKYCQ